MPKLAWVVVGLALIQSSWFVFDGVRALSVGDYVTPSSGPYAGELGPWSNLVSAVGIEPRSTLMKSIHVGVGVLGLVAIVAFVRGVCCARRGMIACAVLGLWYLPFGTVLGIVQILILRTGVVRAVRVS